MSRQINQIKDPTLVSRGEVLKWYKRYKALRETANKQVVLIRIMTVVLVIACSTMAVQNVKLKNRNESLAQAQELLVRFNDPIEYAVAAAPIYDIPLSDELQQYTYETCNFYNIREYYEVVLAMMWRETNFDPTAIGATDDYGIMQINEINHEYLKENLGIVDIMDARDNIHCGVYIFSTLLADNNYNVNNALMAYNMGQAGAEELWAEGIDSSGYSRDVLSKADLIESNQYSKY